MQTETTTPASSPKRGFAEVPCLKCGDTGAVHIYLGEVTRFACASCECDWAADNVREMMEVWQRVLVWVDTAPVIERQPTEGG